MSEELAIEIPHTQADSAWKDILTVWFPEFMVFFYPELATEIDWSAGYESLDKELQTITTQAMLGNRFVDKLMKVKSCEGKELWVLLHIEIQGEKERDFEKRLFEYYYRLLLCLRNWQRSRLAKILMPVLPKNSASPESCSDRGLNRDAILNLYKFLDWILVLPKDLAIRYNNYIHQIEEERTVAYITTAERIGMEKGYEQGMQQGTLEGEKLLLTKQLNRRFAHLSSVYVAKIKSADAETLLVWGEKILDAKTIEDVFGE